MGGEREETKQQCPPGHNSAESGFKLLPERSQSIRFTTELSAPHKCHQLNVFPRRHNSHVLSALYLLGKLGSGAQRVRRELNTPIFGKHRKPRWHTKNSKWYLRELRRGGGKQCHNIYSALEKTSELWATDTEEKMS